MTGFKYFLEYKMKPEDKGYTERNLGIRPGGTGRRYNFDPKPEYEGRRVEGFTTEKEMQLVLNCGRKSLVIATDLRDADDAEAMVQLLKSASTPIFAEIEQVRQELLGKIGSGGSTAGDNTELEALKNEITQLKGRCTKLENKLKKE